MRRQRSVPWHHHPGHPEVVVPIRVDPTGVRGPSARAVRSRAWRRLGGGWFVPADLPTTGGPTGAVRTSGVDQRIVEAAVQLPDYGAVTGWADLRWRGSPWFDGLGEGGRRVLPVPLVIAGGNIRTRDGLAPSKERLAPGEVEVVDGLRVTCAVRSVLFEMRYAATIRQAVRVMDMAAYSDLVSIDEATHYLESHLSGWTGVPQARSALPLCDENSWSPVEGDLRLTWTLDADLPRPVCNVPVFDLDGIHLGTPDLLDPEVGLAGEYDGALHLSGRQRAHDEHREAGFRDAGLEVVVMLNHDRAQPQRFVERLTSAYDRARRSDPRQRRWTTQPPAWWTPSDTVEARRALTGGQQHLLAHRRLAG